MARETAGKEEVREKEAFGRGESPEEEEEESTTEKSESSGMKMKMTHTYGRKNGFLETFHTWILYGYRYIYTYRYVCVYTK